MLMDLLRVHMLLSMRAMVCGVGVRLSLPACAIQTGTRMVCDEAS